MAFLPSHLVSLLSLGINTGLVLDIGHAEATVIPVYEGVPVLHAWGALPLGATAVHTALRDLLQQRARLTGMMVGVGRLLQVREVLVKVFHH